MQTTTDRERNFRHSYTKDRRELLNRLNRIEGQVRGIRRLIGDEAYCLDVLQQVEAMTAAADEERRRGFARAERSSTGVPQGGTAALPGECTRGVNATLAGQIRGACELTPRTS